MDGMKWSTVLVTGSIGIRLTFDQVLPLVEVLMTASLEGVGYEFSVDRDFSNAAKPGHPEYSDVPIVIRPDVDTGPEYRRRGTEDTGPAAPLK